MIKSKIVTKKIVIKYAIRAGSTILIYRFSPPILFSAIIVLSKYRLSPIFFSAVVGYRDTAFRYRFIDYRDKAFRYRAHHWAARSVGQIEPVRPQRCNNEAIITRLNQTVFRQRKAWNTVDQNT